MGIADAVRRCQRAKVNAIALRDQSQRLARADDMGGGGRTLRLGDAGEQDNQRQSQESQGD